MMKRITLLFLAIIASFGSFALMSGPGSVCTGYIVTYTDSLGMAGGTWSSSNTAVANVSWSGMYSAGINGISPGTAIISYVTSSGVDTKIVTVNPSPSYIAGGLVTICHSSTLTLTNATSGGVWSVSGPATIGSSTGVLTAGASSGVAMVTYTVGGCSAHSVVTVSPADSLWGASIVCVGSAISLSSTATGGTWSSSNPTVATVSGGIVTGVLGGTTIISHTTTSGSCGTFVATYTITATTAFSAGTLSGVSSLYIGGAGLAYASVTGGTWSSSTPSVATVFPTGLVYGVSPGTTTISYTVSGCGPTAYATRVVTVNALNGITGHVRYPGWNNIKVWLIKYNPSTTMLTAIDSTWANGVDSGYYQFVSLPTDSYRVKAAFDSGTAVGLLPTYHNSSFYWNVANVINHVSGTTDTNKDINMLIGTPTPGPGFIGGSVLTGANKGTADGAPAVGLGIYLVNSTTSAVVKYTTTDASGNYSFSGLPLGTYKVFPETLSYVTIPYNDITLTSSAASMTTAKFRQRTISKIIQPVTAGVDDLSGAGTSIVAFPNPTNGKLNISWDAATSEAATLVITDVTGREMLAKIFSMTKGNGAQVVDLSSFANGMYFVSVRSANTMYVSKIEVRH